MYMNKLKAPSFEIGSNVKYEKLISNNIKHIKADILYIQHNVGDLSNKFYSNKLLETLRNKLENVNSLISVTKGYLMEWELQIQQSPNLQYNENNYHKLYNQFQREITHINSLSDMINSGSSESVDGSTAIDSSSSRMYTNDVYDEFIYDNNNTSNDLLLNEELIPLFNLNDKELLLSDSIVNIRNNNIKQIKNQILQTYDIFNDISSIISVQEEGLNKVEDNVAKSKNNSINILSEIKQSNKKNNKRRYVLWLIVLSSLVSYCVYFVYTYLMPLML
ncbi:putative integral membrane protein [Theileria parva strain Muguga]|uniref:putative integral membrane protein n=1 Tax=Theileria parva strain Muguga TaxID=333668 RepID=UPI001C61C190|nr:putative integral membrane protein [Theileria parva strain Muguga]EAN31119.2 putative integral membrane protein [Theileria parva strain Muguga]